jgi:hypothetical protein
MGDVLVFGVDVVEDSVRVGLVARSEDDDLEVFAGFFKTLHEVGSQVDAGTDGLFVWEVDFKDHVRILSFNVINAMHQSLVHVKDQKLFLLLRCWWRQVHKLVFDCVLTYHCEETRDGFECCLSVLQMLFMLIVLVVGFLDFRCHSLGC